MLWPLEVGVETGNTSRATQKQDREEEIGPEARIQLDLRCGALTAAPGLTIARNGVGCRSPHLVANREDTGRYFFISLASPRGIPLGLHESR
jgi:hypothetical protein